VQHFLRLASLGLILTALAAASSGCSKTPAPEPAVTQRAASVDATRIAAAASEPQNWLTTGRTYAEERFSPLTSINDQNVRQLGLAWYYETDSTIGSEATPLVADGVMYTSTVWNILAALDAKTGKELWHYDPEVKRTWMRYMCCGPANRGPALWKGKVYEGTIDGRLIAVDATTGKLVWSVQTTDTSQPYSITGAPRVVHGKVIIGNGGAEFGVRGYVTAYDAQTGKQVWRFYIVPGDPSKPYEQPELERAAQTWKGDLYWKTGGGGTAWDSFAYDPDLNFLYIGTGNGAPWSRDLRSPGGGDNLFLCSIVAVNADTGQYVWHYQAVPGENWDFTCVQQMTLAEISLNGVKTKVIMQAPKNGFFYVLDRTTGKLLSAKNFVPVNWASHVDLATGRPVENKENLYSDTAGKVVIPAHFAAHNWQPMSFSPLTGLVYIPAQETAWVYSHAKEYVHHPMAWNLAQSPTARRPPGSDNLPFKGYLLAWNPVTNAPAWRVEHASAWNGGVLSTAGNLVVQGAADGKLAIYRADTGTKLWEMPIQTGAEAGPISYSVDGEQYIAVAAGWSGSMAIIGWSQVPSYHAPTRILAFKLGGTASLPPLAPRGAPAIPDLKATPAMIERGKQLFGMTCRICHGGDAISGGMTPDLRYMSAETHAQFKQIVLYGARASKGMAPFADVLKEDDVDALHAYIVERAKLIPGSAP
jgi:quinohemoprotein ethanol dehydrogenase